MIKYYQQNLSKMLSKFLFSEALIDSYVDHDDFVSVNNVLREYSEMKELIKNPKNAVEYAI